MMKIALFALIGVVLLSSCSGSIRRTASYPQPLPQKAARLLVNEAGKHVGEPYHYGGTTRKGWDCSGFVKTVYQRTLNITLPRTSDEMFRSSFQIPPSYARPGDLVFFKIRHKKPSHVGIFIGDNRFIHVSTSDGVIISKLDDPYYQRYLLAIKRIPPELVASTR
jgi:murein DD-endopeptidase / murein LD-carboxypeptidase